MTKRTQHPMSTTIENETAEFSHLENAIARTERCQSDDADTHTELQITTSVDGRRVTVSGKDEIVLKCGEASITLRRNGRIVIKGTYVETRAAGTNRIKGGSVQIN
jgi:hypothetical protein